VVELSENQTQSSLICSYARLGVPPALATAATGEWQVWSEKIRRGEIVVLERLDDLPAEATRERELALEIGLKSYLAIPLNVGRVSLGFIAFISFRRERAWPQELLPRLRLIGEIFANAIARYRADEELRQSYAELQTRNEELDAFAHTVAHDLKGPVSLLIASAEVLLDVQYSLTEEERQRTTLMMAHAGHKMNSIIQELFLLSQVRTADIATQRLDMGSLAEEARQRLAQMSADYQVELTAPAASEWPVAMGYGPWIEEVWVNYLSNAVKYGGRPPRVELGADHQPSGMLRFWVRDNGPGITPEAQARLFTPFTRLDQVHVQGHGLGLSIVRRIVEKLGGQVGVESQVGQGSTFYFTLPAAPPIE
jgi:signal transduction histidine kinase